MATPSLAKQMGARDLNSSKRNLITFRLSKIAIDAVRKASARKFGAQRGYGVLAAVRIDPG